MKIAVIGLGLIGGSVAKAFKKFTDFTVFGCDKNPDVIDKALEEKSIDAEMGGKIGECDIVVLGLYPEAAIGFVSENADKINKKSIVVDVGGVKEKVCSGIHPIAAEYGFTFIGMHPMAGIEKFGFDYSKADMFMGASLVMTPFDETPEEKVELVKNTFLRLGFGKIQMSTPSEHDRIIAYTSQLAHVVSSAYVKSPAALNHGGFSAGSFKDLTRVARLNETMWTELFLENPRYLAAEIDLIIEHLREYSQAIKSGDKDKLFGLLKDGREKKELSDDIDNKE